MKKITCIVFLLITSISFCQTEWTNYENSEYSVSFPENWDLDRSGQMNTAFLLFSEMTKDDTFRENVNLLIETSRGKDSMSLEAFSEISEKQIKAYVKDGKIIKSENHGTYHSIIWSGFLENNDLKFKQYYFVKDGKTYILTFTALETTFEEHIETGSKILNSFKLN